MKYTLEVTRFERVEKNHSWEIGFQIDIDGKDAYVPTVIYDYEIPKPTKYYAMMLAVRRTLPAPIAAPYNETKPQVSNDFFDTMQFPISVPVNITEKPNE